MLAQVLQAEDLLPVKEQCLPVAWRKRMDLQPAHCQKARATALAAAAGCKVLRKVHLGLAQLLYLATPGQGLTEDMA
jgi:hypothetical protein